MTDTVNVLAICGSLRSGSYNAAALRAAQAMAPEGMVFVHGEIAAIPLYNEDVKVKGFPAPVEALAEKIRTADLILFASPEYNYSVPGVLKNALDWISRMNPMPLAGKPAALMGASMGPVGTGRMQYHLRQIGVFLDLHFMNKPEVLIASAHERFDAQGQLLHEPTREHLKKFMAAVQAWALRHRR